MSPITRAQTVCPAGLKPPCRLVCHNLGGASTVGHTVTHSTLGMTKGYIHKTIFTLYIAPLLTTCIISDAWKQTVFRIPQMGIKAFSSCTTACQGGPTVSLGLLQAEAVPCGPVPWPELFVHCLLLTMPQYNSNIINQSFTVKK